MNSVLGWTLELADLWLWNYWFFREIFSTSFVCVFCLYRGTFSFSFLSLLSSFFFYFINPLFTPSPSPRVPKKKKKISPVRYGMSAHGFLWLRADDAIFVAFSSSIVQKFLCTLMADIFDIHQLICLGHLLHLSCGYSSSSWGLLEICMIL